MTATSTPKQFDPAQYKETTHAQWQAAAQAWNEWGPFLHRWLGPATETMLDLADVGPGDRVLDVAAGAGDQTLAGGRARGPGRLRARHRHLREPHGLRR